MSNLIAFSALFLSVLAIGFTYYVVILSKRVETTYNQFKMMCLDIVVVRLDKLEDKIGNIASTEDVNKIEEELTDLIFYCIELRKYYPWIKTNDVCIKCEELPDRLLEELNSLKSNYRKHFYITKLNLINYFYQNALFQQLSKVEKKLFYFMEKSK